VEEKPAAILWTGADGQWQPLVRKLQEPLPHLVVHGNDEPTKRAGPAIWLKCVVARTIDIGLPKDSVAIVHLPRRTRQAANLSASKSAW